MDLCSPVLRVLRVLPVPLEQARHLDYGAAKRSQKKWREVKNIVCLCVKR